MADRYPDRLAVYDQHSQLSYRELDQAANKFANAILAEKGHTAPVIAIFASLDVTALVAALGVLKAGRAYVGFDDALPDSYCAQILRDAGSTLIVSDAAHADQARRLASHQQRIISIAQSASYPAQPPATPISPDTMAILNYSSGSTGQPKGVAQTHHSAMAQAAGFASQCHLGSGDRVTNFSALAWVGAFWTSFGPLLLGAVVATCDVRGHNSSQLLDWLEQTDVTVIMGSPSLVCQIAEQAEGYSLPGVRLVHMGGDTIYRRYVERCRRAFPTALISAGLGTSEAGRLAEWLIDADAQFDGETVPVGLALPGIKILLLNEEGEEVEEGEAGEIAVQSSYQASGYWKRPDLTAAKFRIDPRFGPLPIYLTGDIGRFEANGSLRHLGRKDFQVKIRGYRVHINEIEGHLIRQSGILEACVALQRTPNQNDVLVAYVVAAPESTERIDELQASLAADLPAYMIPQRFVFLPELPRTPNKKLDRNRLPGLTSTRPDLSNRFAAPNSPMGLRLTAIWEEVLGISPIGINDTFLALGGDSLKATQVANRVLRSFGLNIPLMTILSAATVAKMASIVLEHLLSELSDEESRELLNGEMRTT